ncbi:MAG: hypothetical protein M3146_05200, partial [Thermoproteota archaeon]|nr:hypothetical protein [Thermoproteota archaeon]
KYAKAYFMYHRECSPIIGSLSRKVFKKGCMNKWTLSSLFPKVKSRKKVLIFVQYRKRSIFELFCDAHLRNENRHFWFPYLARNDLSTGGPFWLSGAVLLTLFFDKHVT